jgi:hypothetical protein
VSLHWLTSLQCVLFSFICPLKTKFSILSTTQCKHWRPGCSNTEHCRKYHGCEQDWVWIPNNTHLLRQRTHLLCCVPHFLNGSDNNSSTSRTLGRMNWAQTCEFSKWCLTYSKQTSNVRCYSYHCLLWDVAPAAITRHVSQFLKIKLPVLFKDRVRFLYIMDTVWLLNWKALLQITKP